MNRFFRILFFAVLAGISAFTGCSTYKPLLSSSELENEQARYFTSYAGKLVYSGYIPEALTAYERVYTSLLESGRQSEAQSISLTAYSLAVSNADTLKAKLWEERTGGLVSTFPVRMRAKYLFGKDAELQNETLPFTKAYFTTGDSLEILLLRTLSLIRTEKPYTSELQYIKYFLSLNLTGKQDSFTLAFAAHTASLGEFLTGDKTKALRFVNQAKEIDTRLSNSNGLAEDYLLTSRILFALKNSEQALVSANEARQVFTGLNNPEGMENALAMQLIIKNAQNDYQSAHLLNNLKNGYTFNSTKKLIQSTER